MLFHSVNLRVETGFDGRLATVWLDVKDQRFNLISTAFLDDLDEALQVISAQNDVRLLVIRSAKPTGFLAGADVHQFLEIKSPEQAQALSAHGQEVFGRLANLTTPTLALVHGPCLGGGLELALASHVRLALDVPGTQFGFPEVELGLLPAWGGTQRLPRVVGLENALRMILAGRRLNPAEARRWELISGIESIPSGRSFVDWQVPHSFLAAMNKGGPELRWPSWRRLLLESTPPGRWLIFRGTERLLRRRLPEDMPAPLEALRAVRVGFTEGTDAGLRAEQEAAGRLATTPACRNLVRLFLLREETRKLPPHEGERLPIRRIGVVGAGTMGAGIAQLAALRGCQVALQEINELELGRGTLKIAELFQQAVERRLLSPEQMRQRLGAIHPTTQWQGFDEAEVVIEAVFEDLETKRAVFRELEERTRPATILATNTSSLLVGCVQEGLQHPERVAGLHFFNPVHKMPLIEVVRNAATGEEAIYRLRQFAVALGKTPIVVKDSPGYVVNRILIPYLNEAALLLAEGISTERIDQSMRRFGMVAGPLELLDQVGLDVAAHIARGIGPFFGERMAPSPLFERMKEQGWLGQKSGRGFYVYRGKRKKASFEVVSLVHAKETGEMRKQRVPLKDKEARVGRERMVLLMVNEAAACWAEGLLAHTEHLDLAMVLGTGWAPHRGGPLRYADERGAGEIVTALEALAKLFGPRFDPCGELQKLAATKGSFYGELGPGKAAND